MKYDFSGERLVEFNNRLGDDWRPLATALEIPGHMQRQFSRGQEGYDIIELLRNRDRLDDLPPACEKIDRSDLANLFQAEGESGPTIEEWRSTEETDTLEKIMGEQSTILPISFLEQGMELSRAVARVVAPNETGSGFLIANNWLITNHHVLKSVDQAKETKVQFNYQKKWHGTDAIADEYTPAPENGGFFSSERDDWTAVKLNGDANQKWGAISIGDHAAVKNGRAIIIQHPGGDSKSIAMYHNIVTYADENIVQYLTDTRPGSSGSPVFDGHWNLVAIHRSGGWLLQPWQQKTSLEKRRNRHWPVDKWSECRVGRIAKGIARKLTMEF